MSSYCNFYRVFCEASREDLMNILMKILSVLNRAPGVPRPGMLKRLRLAILLVAHGVFFVTVKRPKFFIRKEIVPSGPKKRSKKCATVWLNLANLSGF